LRGPPFVPTLVFAMSPSTAPHDALPALAAARDAAVVCDLAPLALLRISGPDAGTFLHGQVSSDVTGLADGEAQYTSFNSPKGRMLANFVLWREKPEEFRALLPGDLASPVRKRLAIFVLRSKVTLTDVSDGTARYGVGGPAATATIEAALGVAPLPFAIARAPSVTVLGVPGPRYVILAPAESAAEIGNRLAHEAVRAPFAVWQWLTIRAGVPVVTTPVQDQLIAQAANWDVLGGINFQKGCYTGQEIIARMQYLGRLKERLFSFHANADSVTPGTRIFGPTFGEQACGIVVNAASAPEGGCDLLAVVQLTAVAAGDLRLGSPHGAVLSSIPLPYAVPPPQPPRARAGAVS
jgi:tRNA-modifying protein YgfZ